MRTEFGVVEIADNNVGVATAFGWNKTDAQFLADAVKVFARDAFDLIAIDYDQWWQGAGIDLDLWMLVQPFDFVP